MRADVAAAVEALVALYPESQRAEALRQIIQDSIEELGVLEGAEGARRAVVEIMGDRS